MDNININNFRKNNMMNKNNKFLMVLFCIIILAIGFLIGIRIRSIAIFLIDDTIVNTNNHTNSVRESKNKRVFLWEYAIVSSDNRNIELPTSIFAERDFYNSIFGTIDQLQCDYNSSHMVVIGGNGRLVLPIKETITKYVYPDEVVRPILDIGISVENNTSQVMWMYNKPFPEDSLTIYMEKADAAKEVLDTIELKLKRISY